MPRITISINASGEPNDQDLLTLDLPPGLTIADLKGMIEVETKFPPSTQTLFFNGQALRTDTQTLEQARVNDGEMLAVMVKPQAQNPPSTRPAGSSSRRPPPNTGTETDTPERIEEIRRQILANPEQLAALIQQQPGLAEAIQDSTQFRDTWLSMLGERDRAQREREEEMKMLNEDPFNVDAQRKIEEMIRREKIEANLQYAYENNPEVFGRVSMLYVDVKVNDHSIKAFVDSGAQTTIMSPSCAEACGLSYLIDERFGGIARGVGTAKILGRVHHAKIEIGDAQLDCAFTVMEGKDVDLLFGLDMLRRHQACIDLMAGELRFPHTRVKFLGESEIPKRLEESMMDEPTVTGPEGLEVGATTGSIRPAGSSAEAARHLHGQGSSGGGSGKQLKATTTRAPAPAASSSGSAPPAQPEHQFPEKAVEDLIGLGFSRKEAIQALEATGGNIELAAGLLFQ